MLYPYAFNSKHERIQALADLQSQVDDDLRVRKILKERYKNAIWASDMDDQIRLQNQYIARSNGLTRREIGTDPMSTGYANMAQTKYSKGIEVDDDDEFEDDQSFEDDSISQALSKISQEEAKNVLKRTYSSNVKLISKKIRPVMIEDKSINETSYFGENGNLFIDGSGKQESLIDQNRIDWRSTLSRVISEMRQMKISDSNIMKLLSNSQARSTIEANDKALRFYKEIYDPLAEIDMINVNFKIFHKGVMNVRITEAKRLVNDDNRVQKPENIGVEKFAAIAKKVQELYNEYKSSSKGSMHTDELRDSDASERSVGAFDTSMMGATDIESKQSSLISGKGFNPSRPMLLRQDLSRNLRMGKGYNSKPMLMRQELSKLLGQRRLGNTNKRNQRELMLAQRIMPEYIEY